MEKAENTAETYVDLQTKREYLIYQFTASKGFPLFLQVEKMLLPARTAAMAGQKLTMSTEALKAIAEGDKQEFIEKMEKENNPGSDADTSSGENEVNSDIFQSITVEVGDNSKAAEMLVKHLDDEKFMKLAKDLLKVVFYKTPSGGQQNVEAVFDEHFRGNYHLMIRLIEEVCRVNSFFDRKGEGIMGLLA